MTTRFSLPGISVREFTIAVPLDWGSSAETHEIDLFVRELVDPLKRDDDLPLLLYLEGGPGGSAPRPLSRTGWLDEALRDYRVILIDQRGTGRSHRLEAADLAGLSATVGADLLSHFRADSIVRDLEHVRLTEYDGRRWSLLGQSYGGFLTLTYLSQAPQALIACFVCGGIPGVPPSAAEVYRRTVERARTKTAEFYRRFPGDQEITAAIADRLEDGTVLLPDGDVLTVRRVQSLGLGLGMDSGPERLHWLLESAFVGHGSRRHELSDAFLEQVMVATSSASDPLFWTLQENIYADVDSGPTAWAAQTELDAHADYRPDARPVLFTAEMAFEWMFDEIRLLRDFGPAVREMASRTDWPGLYDLDRLAANEVPLAAAVYFDDIFVDSTLQLETLTRVGNSHAWVTNEFAHDGISSGRVLTRLRELLRDRGELLQ